MLQHILRPRFGALPLLLVLIAACGDGSGTEPQPDPIVITVTGVDEGATYTEPVTIGISTSRGTYEARLDGELFLDGQTVTEIGTHTLTISARDGADTASLTVGFELVFQGTSVLIVRVFDLGDNEAGGGGDAILLTDSAQGLQVHALVDVGPAGEDASNPGFVADRLTDLGVTALEALVLTHAHSDHYAGIPAVVGAVDIERFIHNDQRRSLGGYRSAVNAAESAAETVIVPTEQMSFFLSDEGGTELTVIPPLDLFLDQDTNDGMELNEGSVGIAARRGSFAMFLTGDGERLANARWRRDFASLTADLDVLKVGHHGANDAIFDAGSGGTSSWLDHTQPEILLISANGKSHPRKAALNEIMGLPQARAYCTNVHGTIEVRVRTGGETTVDVERNADSDCEPGDDAST